MTGFLITSLVIIIVCLAILIVPSVLAAVWKRP